jgi:hypothetical protein
MDKIKQNNPTSPLTSIITYIRPDVVLACSTGCVGNGGGKGVTCSLIGDGGNWWTAVTGRKKKIYLVWVLLFIKGDEPWSS